MAQEIEDGQDANQEDLKINGKFIILRWWGGTGQD